MFSSVQQAASRPLTWSDFARYYSRNPGEFVSELFNPDGDEIARDKLRTMIVKETCRENLAELKAPLDDVTSYFQTRSNESPSTAWAGLNTNRNADMRTHPREISDREQVISSAIGVFSLIFMMSFLMSNGTIDQSKHPTKPIIETNVSMSEFLPLGLIIGAILLLASYLSKPKPTRNPAARDEKQNETKEPSQSLATHFSAQPEAKHNDAEIQPAIVEQRPNPPHPNVKQLYLNNGGNWFKALLLFRNCKTYEEQAAKIWANEGEPFGASWKTRNQLRNP